MQSTPTTHAGLAMLCWFAKKRHVVDSLKGLQLELIFCSARGTLTKAQEVRAKKKARTYIYLLNYYKKRYSLSLQFTKRFS